MDFDDALATWEFLNMALLRVTEEDCRELLARELRGQRRRRFLLRTHSRLNYLRAQRERAEIMNATR